MSFTHRRLLVLSVLFTTSAWAASAAHAEGTDRVHCTFSGNLVATPVVRLMGGEGSYNFTSVTGICNLVDEGEPNEAGSADVTIQSTGEYENGLCVAGPAPVWTTGTLDSEEWEGGAGDPLEPANELSTPAVINAVSASSQAVRDEFPIKFNYHVDVAGGIGTITISDWARDDKNQAGTSSQHADGDGATGNGAAGFTPKVAGLLPPDCATGFGMAGHLDLELSDDP